MHAVLQCCSASVLLPGFPPRAQSFLFCSVGCSATVLQLRNVWRKSAATHSFPPNRLLVQNFSQLKASPLVSFTDDQFCLTTWGEVGELKIGLKDTLNVGNVFEHFHSAPNMDSSQRSVWSTESKDCVKRTPLKIIRSHPPKTNILSSSLF